jgi:hypothetical protein
MKATLKLLLLSLVFIAACKKGPGEGGTSSIKGNVWVKDYNSTFTTLNAEYAGAGENVYIIYGDEVSYGDKIETNYKGEYEFKYLRPGKYTIYAYSNDSVNPNGPDVAMVKEVEVSGKNQKVDAPLITIYK